MALNSLRLLFWESTQKCNLSCLHCRMDSAKTAHELTTDQARFLIDSICEFASPVLIFSGGEPLLREDIFILADYSKTKKLPTALATNGTLITESIAKEIISSGIAKVSVSIDGADSITHDNFRNQTGCFSQAINGIEILVKNKISSQINASITTQNAHQLQEMIELALKLGVDAIHFFMVVPVGCGKTLNESHYFTAEEYESLLKEIYKLNKLYQDRIFLKVTCAPQYNRIVQQNIKNTDSNARISKGCLAGTGICFVSARGDVYPCGYMPVLVGNIFQTKLKDIWEDSTVLKDLRDPSKLKKNCSICSYISICGGCRARAYSKFNEDFLECDPSCIINTKI